MSQLTFPVYRFYTDDTYTPPTIQALTTNSQTMLNINTLNHPTNLHNSRYYRQQTTIDTTFPNPIQIPLWYPNRRLRSLHTRFQNTILYQHICVPCVFCGRLLYPKKAKWLPYDENINYPLQIAFPDIDLVFTESQTLVKVSACSTCAARRRHYLCPQLCAIPPEIEAIPLT